MKAKTEEMNRDFSQKYKEYECVIEAKDFELSKQ